MCESFDNSGVSILWIPPRSLLSYSKLQIIIIFLHYTEIINFAVLAANITLPSSSIIRGSISAKSHWIPVSGESRRMCRLLKLPDNAMSWYVLKIIACALSATVKEMHNTPFTILSYLERRRKIAYLKATSWMPFLVRLLKTTGIAPLSTRELKSTLLSLRNFSELRYLMN